MTRLLALITAARADYIQHREPEPVSEWPLVICGSALVGLMLVCLVVA